MMKHLLKTLTIVWITALITSCASTAGIHIEGNEEFVLGEYANHRFSAKVSNLSRDQVDVVIIDTDTKEQTQGFGLPGRNSARINVSKNETVIFRNPNDSKVKVKAKLSRGVEGMRYQPVYTTDNSK